MYNSRTKHSPARAGRLANLRQRFGWQALRIITCLLILKVTIAIVGKYGNYFPPDFRCDFLMGREAYFYGVYRWAFYGHIVSGPFSLVAGMFLLSNGARWHFPKSHRIVGRIQVACILLLVVPSGLWMARFALTGPVAGIGFGVLSIMTGVCAIGGWIAAMRKQFERHRRWMLRCCVLLCSAVVLRLMGGCSEVLEIESPWVYSAAAWISWTIPLIILECCSRAPLRATVDTRHSTDSIVLPRDR